MNDSRTIFWQLDEELQEIRHKKLYRCLRALKPAEGPYARLDDRSLLLFCSNDYLGFSKHPRVVESTRQALATYGVGAGAARLISGTSDLHELLEQRLAAFKGKEAALLYTTGYLTNLGILSALAGKNDLIIMDKLCHASLVDGARLSGAQLRIYPHKDYERCEELLQQGKRYQKTILVTDGVFSMDGDLADLERLCHLKASYGCLLVVDDAHGTGVLGAHGSGVAEALGVGPRIDILMGTMSKALGGVGGFVVADQVLIEYLINRSRPFIFATALPPAVCAGILTALELLKEEPQHREKLWQNIRMLERLFKEEGFLSKSESLSSPIVPLLVGDEECALKAAEELLAHGILVPAIRYPAVAKGKARLRITLSALHEPSHLQWLTAILKKVLA